MKRTARQPHARCGGPARRRGMTLVELLVSVGVLSVMILAFSTILTQSQQFISLAHASRRSHALAASIARIIRRDIRQISQDGILAITTADDGSPMLIVTAVGPASSIMADTEAVSSTARLICYGEADNNASNKVKGTRLLWRPSYVLVGDSATGGLAADCLDLSLGMLKAMTREQIHTRVIDQEIGGLNAAANTQLRVPVENDLAGIEDLWQVLAAGCSDLSITWTNGQIDQATGNLLWFGVDRSDSAMPVKLASTLDETYANTVEDTNYNSGDSYRALWTHRDQTNWPRAIKIRFRLNDKNLPERKVGQGANRRRTNAVDYEIICSIGQ